MSEGQVPREAVATPEDVAKVLSLTGEQIEELRREQLLQLSRSRARLSPDKRRVARGIELERHHRESGDPDGLAEALRLQGRFGEAAAVARDSTLKAECAAYGAALDAAKCRCDNFEDDGENLIPNHYVEVYLHSTRHGREMPFIRCRKCARLYAGEVPEHLRLQREVRRSSATDREREEFFKKK